MPEGQLLDITFSDIEGGYSGVGNLDLDPEFRNETAEDYHLRHNSPCMDAGTSDGTPSTDKDGVSRWDNPSVPNNGGGAMPYYDIGAYEFVDSDSDTLPDYWEIDNALDPNDDGTVNPDNGASGDPDGDSLSNSDEYLNMADPRSRDSDCDGRDDLNEVSMATNPGNPDNVEMTYYVNDLTGDDSYDGLTSAIAESHGPKKTIQAAIDAADHRWGYVIEVADGTYRGLSNKNLDFNGKDLTLKSVNGSEYTTIDCENNGRAFFFHNMEGRDSIIDGFTIVNGYVIWDISRERGFGGAAKLLASEPTIRNCHIIGNTSKYGGGLYFQYRRPLVSNCMIEYNEALFGGAFDLWRSEASMVDCEIAHNVATLSGGGGIYISDCCPAITRCEITSNTCVDRGGGVSSTDDYSGRPILTDCTICMNQAGRDGGGISTTGTIINCLISNNNALRNGGGLWGNATVTDSVITYNTAGEDGGGISEGYALAPVIVNCTIAHNTAGQNGGAIKTSEISVANCLITGNSATNGGAVYCHGYHSPTVYNCTIADNLATSQGGGLFCYSHVDAVITNCILWNDSPDEYYEDATSSGSLTYCDIQGGWPDVGNFDADPLFVRGPLHDYYLSQIASGQSQDSPCIDAGSDTAENLGLDALTTRNDSQPDADTVDMGYHAPLYDGLYITWITRSDDHVTIHWSAGSGVSYTVQHSTNMVDWTDVPVGETDTWTNTDVTETTKFYRVFEQ
jgi:predicted outer membrane repeat protein